MLSPDIIGDMLNWAEGRVARGDMNNAVERAIESRKQALLERGILVSEHTGNELESDDEGECYD